MYTVSQTFCNVHISLFKDLLKLLIVAAFIRFAQKYYYKDNTS